MKTVTTLFLFFAFLFNPVFSQEVATDKKEHNRPRQTYQVGSAKIVVWENKGLNGTTWNNYQIEKVYKKDDQWKTTNSFNEAELLQLREAIDKAIKDENVKAIGKNLNNFDFKFR